MTRRVTAGSQSFPSRTAGTCLRMSMRVFGIPGEAEMNGLLSHCRPLELALPLPPQTGVYTGVKLRLCCQHRWREVGISRLIHRKMKGGASTALLSQVPGHTGFLIMYHVHRPQMNHTNHTCFLKDHVDSREEIHLLSPVHTYKYMGIHTHMRSTSTASLLPKVSPSNFQLPPSFSLDPGYPHLPWHLPGSSLATPSSLRRPGPRA